MNSDKRMAELYLERDAGKKHLIDLHTNNWHPKAGGDFCSTCDYKLKPETLEEFITRIDTSVGDWESDIHEAIKWAWANPESKE